MLLLLFLLFLVLMSYYWFLNAPFPSFPCCISHHALYVLLTIVVGSISLLLKTLLFLFFHICHKIYAVRPIWAFPWILHLTSETAAHLSLNLSYLCLIPSQWIGASFQMSFTLLYLSNICSSVSTSFPHIVHIGSPTLTLLQISSLTGTASVRPFHINILTLWLMFKLHKTFHTCWLSELQLNFAPSPSFLVSCPLPLCIPTA
mgnify:CR=1 FL=1